MFGKSRQIELRNSLNLLSESAVADSQQKSKQSPHFITNTEIMAAFGQIFNRIGQLGVGLALAGGVANSALYNVDGGHRAVMFDRFRGVLPNVTGEGTHFMIPWVQRPIIYDIRARPKNVPSITGKRRYSLKGHEGRFCHSLLF